MRTGLQRTLVLTKSYRPGCVACSWTDGSAFAPWLWLCVLSCLPPGVLRARCHEWALQTIERRRCQWSQLQCSPLNDCTVRCAGTRFQSCRSCTPSTGLKRLHQCLQVRSSCDAVGSLNKRAMQAGAKSSFAAVWGVKRVDDKLLPGVWVLLLSCAHRVARCPGLKRLSFK